jgi:hypothetical protein
VRLLGGGEDVFADESMGGEETSDLQAARATTLFCYGYDVSPSRFLTVSLTQRFLDRRYSSAFETVGSVPVAYYGPSEWEAVHQE